MSPLKEEEENLDLPVPAGFLDHEVIKVCEEIQESWAYRDSTDPRVL